MPTPSWKQWKSSSGHRLSQIIRPATSALVSVPPSRGTSPAPNSGEDHGYRTALFLLCLLLLSVSTLGACAPVISRQLRDEAGIPVPFVDLLEHPDAYKGRVVILGGYILQTANKSDGTLITVLQASLDFQNKPKSRDLSQGRFLVHSDKFLDPEVYSTDRKLTVGGRVSGYRQQPLDSSTYRYPVIEAEQIHLWPREVAPIWPYSPYDYWHYPWYPYAYPLRPYPW
jgi:outer membrane lipoprotein